MPKPIYVKPLSENEELKIQEIMNNSSKNISIRAKIVLLSNDGYTVPEIVPQVNRHNNIVRHWINEFNSIAMDIFHHQNKGKGRPAKLTKHIESIVSVALSKPRELGQKFTTWSLNRLRKYLKDKLNITISKERLRQILLKEGIAFHKAKDWIHSNDPEYQKKKDDILSLYNNPPTNSVVLCFDEKGTIAVKDYGGGQWSTGSPKHYLHFKTRGTTELFATYNPITKEVLCEFTEKKTLNKPFSSFNIYVRSIKVIM